LAIVFNVLKRTKLSNPTNQMDLKYKQNPWIKEEIQPQKESQQNSYLHTSISRDPHACEEHKGHPSPDNGEKKKLNIKHFIQLNRRAL
jgi:hypothetical protein